MQILIIPQDAVPRGSSATGYARNKYCVASRLTRNFCSFHFDCGLRSLIRDNTIVEEVSQSSGFDRKIYVLRYLARGLRRGCHSTGCRSSWRYREATRALYGVRSPWRNHSAARVGGGDDGFVPFRVERLGDLHIGGNDEAATDAAGLASVDAMQEPSQLPCILRAPEYEVRKDDCYAHGQAALLPRKR